MALMTSALSSEETGAQPEGKPSEESHPIKPGNSVLSYVADIDSIFLPYTDYVPSKKELCDFELY